MKLSGTELELSATDLSNFLGCRHRTALDMAVAHRAKGRPRTFDDPLFDLLIKRGNEHEASYVESLKASGRSVTDLRESESNPDEHVAKTLEAMRGGADVIVQGARSH